MRHLFIVFLLITSQFCIAQTSSLMGSWTVDLRPTPESEAYYQAFEISEASNSGMEGSFYGSTIEDAFINTEWDRLYFGFTTRDQNSTYYHTGYLLDEQLYGISYCPDRGFTIPWTGVRK